MFYRFLVNPVFFVNPELSKEDGEAEGGCWGGPHPPMAMPKWDGWQGMPAHSKVSLRSVAT